MRDSQTVPAATFDHFDFFFSWVGYSILFFFLTGSVFSSGFFFSLVRSSVLLYIYIYIYILASVSLGT